MVIRLFAVLFLVFHSSNPARASTEDLFWDALRNNDIPSIIALVKSGYSPDTSTRADTPLGYTIRWGYLELAKALLDLGANPNLPEPISQYTPLMVAAKYQKPDAIEPLISHGADVNQTSVFGRNALHMAALYNSIEVARNLLRLTDIETNTRGKLCPLAVSSRQGYLDFVKMLIAECKTPFSSKCLSSAKEMAEYNHHQDVLDVLNSIPLAR